VRFHPASAGTGVVFVRRDLPGEPQVECRLEHVVLQPRWSSLEQNGIVIHFTEHILAALAGCDLDNVCVELDSDRVPVITGGSCLGFAQALAAGGTDTLDAPRSVFRLKRPIHLEAALDVPAGVVAPSGSVRRHIEGVPANAFTASYVFHVPAVAGMRVGLAEFEQERDDFTRGIGCARTYYLQVEQGDVSSLLSSARREYIVLHAESPQEDVDEVARHKLMDLWGDLRLLGKPVWGRFSALRTGHRFHHELICKLAGEDYLETLELADRKEFA
jgi:UDP-3-O-acyl-N-acetylglucosamine deacetylase